MLFYGLLNIPYIQNYAKNIIINELKAKLQTDLDIASLYIKPFNIIQLNGVYINDQESKPILNADKIYVDLDLLPLLNKQLIFSAAKLSDFDIFLSKDSTKGKLNIQFIIDAFKSKDTINKQNINVKINSLNISNGHFKFDISDHPELKDKFDPNHIEVFGLNAKLSLKSLHSDSLNVHIKKLSLKEKSGLEIKNLIARLVSQDKHLSIKGFQLSLPKSLLQLEKCEIEYPQFLSPAYFLDHAIFKSKISSSYIALKDIVAFVPAFKNFEDRILFKSQIEGKLDSIHVSNITLDYGYKMHLSAKGYVQDIRNQEKTYIRGNIEKLTLSEDAIISIINNFSETKKETPAIFSNLGGLSFQGHVTGLLKDMKAEGNMHSQLGTLYANAVIGINPDPNRNLLFEGHLKTEDFQLGKLIGNKDLENISFNLSALLSKSKQNRSHADIKGSINSLTFKKYTYRDIKIDGIYNGQTIDGNLFLNDPNIKFSINGLFDLSNKNPQHKFYARLKNIRLDNLHLSNKYKEAYLSMAINANFSGNNIEDLQGYIKTDSIQFLQSDKRLHINNFSIEASGTKADRTINIASDIIYGQIKGAYSLSTIVESIKKTIHPYLPALIVYKNKSKKKIDDANMAFDFTINNTENLSDVLQLPFIVYEQSKIKGSYNNQSELFELTGTLPSLKVGGSNIKSGLIKLHNTIDDIRLSLSSVFITKKGTTNNFTSEIVAKNNRIDINTSLRNNDKNKLSGEISNTIFFSREDFNNLVSNIRFYSGELILNNILWKVKDSNIQIKGSTINVDQFAINSTSGNQKLNINGTYSQKNENKKLYIDLQKIDLDYIFNTLAIDALQFGGAASGNLEVSTIKGKPYADINLDVQDFSFNQTKLGNLKLFSDLDNETQKVNLNGKIKNDNGNLTNINGFINPVTQELSINFDANDISVGFLNKYVSTLFNNISGSGSGNVHLFGNFSKVTVEGKAFIKEGNIGINFLNTNYTFTDTIFMKKDLIYFSNISFLDKKGNVAKIGGKVAHDYFSNFMYYIDLSGQNFLLYDVKEKQNSMFYGTIYGSGTGVIKGDEKVIDINMNLRTEGNTNVFMNFMEESAAQYSFITYKTKESVKESTDSQTADRLKPRRLKTDSGIEMNMNFYIDATPDANIEFLMDPVGGDKLKGAGTGALQFTWGTSKDPMLYGTYQINKGSYNFTFQKILERKFMIQDGSSVQFRGDPFQANIDITAMYRIVANLNDLDRNLVVSTGQTNVPVNCLLGITGALRQPSIKLDLALPSADPEVQRQVKSLIGTEDMLNRQIVYLLLLSKFYTPSYAVTDQRTSDLAAVASATLSSQLSKMLSKIDDRWQIGTNIRTSDSEFTSTEVELILSSRLLNDRVLFNGNFGYRDNLETPNAFIGDVDIEVLLNRMGTWRLKAYNHYNEKYYYIRGDRGSVQTQGIGLVYKRDFDTLKELFSRAHRKGEIKSNEQIGSKNNNSIRPDSTQNIQDTTILKTAVRPQFVKMRE